MFERSKKCPLCQQISDFEASEALTFVNDYFVYIPVNGFPLKGTGVLAARAHLAEIIDFGAKELSSFHLLLKEVVAAVKMKYAPAGMSYNWNNGVVAGMPSDHFCLMIYPRYEHESEAGKSLDFWLGGQKITQNENNQVFLDDLETYLK